MTVPEVREVTKWLHEASRLFAAEIEDGSVSLPEELSASMRPRLFAAEILPFPLLNCITYIASRGRGYSPRKSRRRIGDYLLDLWASMRPRLFAAEIVPRVDVYGDRQPLQ